MTIPDFEVVVDAVIVVLYFKGLELECHLVVGWDGNLPSALFIGLVIVGKVGRFQVTALHIQIAPA